MLDSHSKYNMDLRIFTIFTMAGEKACEKTNMMLME